MTATSTAKTVVVTDMDETLICSKSTGYVINFLVQYKAWLRLAVTLPCALILIPLSKIKKPFDGRSLAVRIMYWLAFRGIRVDKAQKVRRKASPSSSFWHTVLSSSLLTDGSLHDVPAPASPRSCRSRRRRCRRDTPPTCRTPRRAPFSPRTPPSSSPRAPRSWPSRGSRNTSACPHPTFTGRTCSSGTDGARLGSLAA